MATALKEQLGKSLLKEKNNGKNESSQIEIKTETRKYYRTYEVEFGKQIDD